MDYSYNNDIVGDGRSVCDGSDIVFEISSDEDDDGYEDEYLVSCLKIITDKPNHLNS